MPRRKPSVIPLFVGVAAAVSVSTLLARSPAGPYTHPPHPSHPCTAPHPPHLPHLPHLSHSTHLSQRQTRAGATAEPWLEFAVSEDAGFSSAKLADARAFADTIRSAAVVAVYRGRLIASWGAVDRNLMLHSVRKSFVGALYGIAIAEGKVKLDQTLAQLRIEDEPPLTTEEKKARIGDLLSARSGVYHRAAYASGDQDSDRPERGSHAPGTFWFYNNWDFNVIEAIYERATGQDVFTAFASKVARQVGMEDYDPDLGLRVLEPSNSRYPAHAFRMSARDMARFGLLYLQHGKWGTRQVVPSTWVRESFRAQSDLGNGQGYGYLWWIYEAGSLGEQYPMLNRGSVYLARGTGGQAIFVIPGDEMVIVHRGDTDNGRSVWGPQIWTLVEQLVAARNGPPAAKPAFGPMRAVALASQLPAPPVPRFVTLDEAVLRRYVGDYEILSALT